MITLVVDWNSVWAMTGMGIGVVFLILVLLVFVLILFGVIFGGKKAPKPAPQPAPAAASAAQAPVNASQDTEAAIATALYLYFQDKHDEESYKLTICHPATPAWHSQLNTRLS